RRRATASEPMVAAGGPASRGPGAGRGGRGPRRGRRSPASTPAPAPSPVAAQGPIETIEVRGSSDEAAGLDTTAFATVIRAEDFADKVTSVPELMGEMCGARVRGQGGEYATV